MGLSITGSDSLSERASMMRESLQKSQIITENVVSILGSFDYRLSALETAMRPTQVCFCLVCFLGKWKSRDRLNAIQRFCAFDHLYTGPSLCFISWNEANIWGRSVSGIQSSLTLFLFLCKESADLLNTGFPISHNFHCNEPLLLSCWWCCYMGSFDFGCYRLERILFGKPMRILARLWRLPMLY